MCFEPLNLVLKVAENYPAVKRKFFSVFVELKIGVDFRDPRARDIWVQIFSGGGRGGSISEISNLVYISLARARRAAARVGSTENIFTL